jgi:hypothetical protein
LNIFKLRGNVVSCPNETIRYYVYPIKIAYRAPTPNHEL